MTPLRRRMIEDLKLRNLAPRTIQSYVSRVAAFARHFGRSPEDLGRDEVRSYLLYLVREKRVCWSTYNQTVAGLRFLYEVTLENGGGIVRREAGEMGDTRYPSYLPDGLLSMACEVSLRRG